MINTANKAVAIWLKGMCGYWQHFRPELIALPTAGMQKRIYRSECRCKKWRINMLERRQVACSQLLCPFLSWASTANVTVTHVRAQWLSQCYPATLLARTAFYHSFAPRILQKLFRKGKRFKFGSEILSTRGSHLAFRFNDSNSGMMARRAAL